MWGPREWAVLLAVRQAAGDRRFGACRELPVSHPSAEPVRERRVNPETVRRVELFSHPPEAGAVEQRRPRASGGHWQAVPFSDGVAE